MHGLANSIIIACFLCTAVLGMQQQERTQNCGRLEERFYFDDSFVTKPTEAPFLGTILYTKDNVTLTVECLATLISERHLIAPAVCIQLEAQEVNPADFRIQLGAFRQTNDTKSYKCNPRGFCIPPPREYRVEGIKIHPLFDPITLAHNLAIMTLQESVNFTPLIQPTCIQAKPKLSSLIARYFQMVGVSFTLKLKVKTNIYTISRRHYDDAYGSLFPYIDTQFSGTQDSDQTFYSGSVLLGANIKEDRPDHFYIVGILLRSGPTDEPHAPMINIFQSIQPYVEWIRTHTKASQSSDAIRSSRSDAVMNTTPPTTTTTTTRTTTILTTPTTSWRTMTQTNKLHYAGTPTPPPVTPPPTRSFASAAGSASFGYWSHFAKANSTALSNPRAAASASASTYSYGNKEALTNSTRYDHPYPYAPPQFGYGAKPNSTSYHRSPYYRY